MWWQMIAAVVVVSLSGSQTFYSVAVDEVHQGKVVSVGGDMLTVMDDKDDDLDKFVVTAATTITRNGKPAKLVDIQVGDTAKVTATQDGAKLVAKSISAIAPE